MKQAVIFTDLDGTLLDHDTYGFEEARTALDALKGKSIPVIICSSKTRAEIEGYQRRMDLTAPFIAENGAAVFTPRDMLKKKRPAFVEKGAYYVAELGTPHKDLLEVWHQVKAIEGFRMQGFSEMTVEEIAALTGLSYEEASLAAMREYSEPFLFSEKADRLGFLERLLRERGLQITKGGRFYHMIGQSDKGKAVRMLREVYEEMFPGTRLWTVGLGDSANDIPMLIQVDTPIVIRKKTGGWEHVPARGPVIYSNKAGPQGWAETLEGVLSEET
jgi:mannosyl-3-phosphoglycerate phosphatase